MPPAAKTKGRGKILGLPTPVVVIVGAVGGYLLYRKYTAGKAAAAAAPAQAADTSTATPYSQMYGGGYGPSAVQTATVPAASSITPAASVAAANAAVTPSAEQTAAENPTSPEVTAVTSSPAQAVQTAAANTGAYSSAVAGTSQSYINAYEAWGQALQQAFPGGLSNPQTPAQVAWLAANPAPVPEGQAAA